MSRSRRMQPVQRAVGDLERRRAERLAAAERALLETQTRLDELSRYHGDYLQRFAALAGDGMGGMGLRDYQTFLARLAAAIRAQAELRDAARVKRDLERDAWQQAATRAKAVERIVDQWRSDERQAAERRDQKESDERAQRPARGNLENS